MSSEFAISARGLGKSYVIEHKERESTAAEALLKRVANPFRRPEREVIWSLKDVSFDIKRGDIVGVVGRNGAGKSTLLKVLSRITAPTTGEARIQGRIGSLIEVGTGFQPELTGRENIFLNGAILGMRKTEIARRFDEIVDFSGVEKFLDTPVKRYSSGMYVRLAFAVAAHLDTEILLVDEVLSVGDAEFQRKSLGKIGEVANSGRTVLFVSHNMATVEALCKTALLMHNGQLLHAGGVAETFTRYQSLAVPQRSADGSDIGPVDLSAKHRFFRSIDVVDEQGLSVRDVPMGGALRVEIEVKSDEPVSYPLFMMFIDNSVGQQVLNVASPKTQRALTRMDGSCRVSCLIESLPLAPGEYAIRIGLAKSQMLDETQAVVSFTVRDADTFDDGWGARRGVCVAPSHWRIHERTHETA
jgi:lipopolysaccharide transport system ATP-binding protein